MMRPLLFAILTFMIGGQVFGQAAWQRTYGGYGMDEGRCIRQTSDLGYIVVGSTGSFGSGASDIYVLKLSGSGEREWSVAIGSPGVEQGWAVRELLTGGYLVAGYTNDGGGSYDGLLVRLDVDGAVIWERHYGGPDWDFVYDLELVPEGAVMVGSTTIDGNEQGWLLKVGAQGEILWEKDFGGEYSDVGRCVRATADGGLVVAGTKTLTDTTHKAWVVRFDAGGNELWETTVGSYPLGIGYSVSQTGDGGFVVGGYAVEPSGRRVMLVAKVDEGGNHMWVNHLDGGQGEWEGRSIRGMDDGRLILAGITSSYGAGGFDYYMAILDEQGQWMSGPSFGSSGDEDCWGLDLTADGSFVLAGTTRGLGPGVSAVYVVKNAGGIIDDPFIEDFDPLLVDEPVRTSDILIAPNPVRAGGMVQVTWPGGYAGTWKADLLALDGRLVAQVHGHPGENAIQVPVQASGTYLLRLNWGPGYMATTRLVIGAE